jgi:hypothetical protein
MNPARLHTLERYFEALRRHDWAALAACLAPDVHRTGPYLDEVRGRDAYRDFLAGVVPKLEGYALEVHAVEPLADGGAWVLLSESMDRAGERRSHPEALRFAFDADDRIARVDVHLKQPPA